MRIKRMISLLFLGLPTRVLKPVMSASQHDPRGGLRHPALLQSSSEWLFLVSVLRDFLGWLSMWPVCGASLCLP